MDESLYDNLAARHGIVLLLQFGSTVTGTTHSRSDLDVAVLLGRAAVSFEERLALQTELEALHPGRPLDLAILDTSSNRVSHRQETTTRLSRLSESSERSRRTLLGRSHRRRG